MEFKIVFSPAKDKTNMADIFEEICESCNIDCIEDDNNNISVILCNFNELIKLQEAIKQPLKIYTSKDDEIILEIESTFDKLKKAKNKEKIKLYGFNYEYFIKKLNKDKIIEKNKKLQSQGYIRVITNKSKYLSQKQLDKILALNGLEFDFTATNAKIISDVEQEDKSIENIIATITTNLTYELYDYMVWLKCERNFCIDYRKIYVLLKEAFDDVDYDYFEDDDFEIIKGETQECYVIYDEEEENI